MTKVKRNQFGMCYLVVVLVAHSVISRSKTFDFMWNFLLSFCLSVFVCHFGLSLPELFLDLSLCQCLCYSYHVIFTLSIFLSDCFAGKCAVEGHSATVFK